jgi:hypothetical protein
MFGLEIYNLAGRLEIGPATATAKVAEEITLILDTITTETTEWSQSAFYFWTSHYSATTTNYYGDYKNEDIAGPGDWACFGLPEGVSVIFSAGYVRVISPIRRTVTFTLSHLA